jgi:fucose 4-O-acetylase-like acetyltransferase
MTGRSKMEKSRRSEYIDILKGIGIVSVVYSHCNLWGGYIVCCFMLPIFFFVSGYLFKERSIKEFVIKKVMSLYVPFVMIELFYLAIRNLLFCINVYNQNSYMSPLTSGKDVVINIIHILLFDTVDSLTAPLWFLAALFGVNLLFFFIHKFIGNNNFLLILVGIILFVTGNLFTALGFEIKQSYRSGQILNVCLVATLFTILGYVCKVKGIKKYLEKLPKVPIIEAILLLILAFFCYVLKLRIDMRINNYSSALGFLVCSTVGIILVCMCAYRIQKIAIIKFILIKLGECSFEIMAYHFSAFKIVSVMLIILFKMDFDLLGYRIIPDLSKVYNLNYFVLGSMISYEISIIVRCVKGKINRRIDNVREKKICNTVSEMQKQ